MESARGAPIAVQRPRGARRVIGAAPRRSDRYAIVRSSSCSPPTEDERVGAVATRGAPAVQTVAAGARRPTRFVRACSRPRLQQCCARAAPACVRPTVQCRGGRVCLRMTQERPVHRESAACGGSHRLLADRAETPMHRG